MHQCGNIQAFDCGERERLTFNGTQPDSFWGVLFICGKAGWTKGNSNVTMLILALIWTYN
jgi:hypothetical protein